MVLLRAQDSSPGCRETDKERHGDVSSLGFSWRVEPGMSSVY